MRQWGRHATAFVGRRHFDDADLLDRAISRCGEAPRPCCNTRRVESGHGPARRHLQHPQGVLALQSPHDGARAARPPARDQRGHRSSCRRCRARTSAMPAASITGPSSRSTSSSPTRCGPSSPTAATPCTTTATTATRSCRAIRSWRGRTSTCRRTCSSAAGCCIARSTCPGSGRVHCLCVHLALNERGRVRQRQRDRETRARGGAGRPPL